MVKLRHPFLKKGVGLKDEVMKGDGVGDGKGKEGEGEDIVVACWYFDRPAEK